MRTSFSFLLRALTAVVIFFFFKALIEQTLLPRSWHSEIALPFGHLAVGIIYLQREKEGAWAQACWGGGGEKGEEGGRRPESWGYPAEVSNLLFSGRPVWPLLDLEKAHVQQGSCPGSMTPGRKHLSLGNFVETRSKGGWVAQRGKEGLDPAAWT